MHAPRRCCATTTNRVGPDDFDNYHDHELKISDFGSIAKCKVVNQSTNATEIVSSKEAVVLIPEVMRGL